MEFIPSHAYRITVGGTVSDWCPPSAKSASDCSYGSPLAVGQGVDGLYCYATWRCPTPELWRQLQIGGKGLDELSGQAGKIAYSDTHRYAVVVHGLGGRLQVVALDAAAGSTYDNSGSFTVEVEDLGGNEPPAGAETGTPSGSGNRATEVEGKVLVRRPGGAFVPLAAGEDVPPGSEVHTYFGAHVLVRMPRPHEPMANVFYVGSLSAVVVRKDMGVYVKVGYATFYDVEYTATPSVVNAVMGTTYSVSYDTVTHATVVSVTKGSVKVQPVGESLPDVVLRPGQEVQVTQTAESKVAPIGLAGAPPGAVTRTKARSLVSAVLTRSVRACRATPEAMTIAAGTNGWRISVKVVSGARSGWAVWDVVGRKATPANLLAKTLTARCAPGATAS